MLELNPTKCHNFENAQKLGRCPLVCVCDSDCAYVWKSLYDTTEVNEDKDSKIEELEERINELEVELEDTEDEANEYEEKADLYDDLIEYVSSNVSKEFIDKLNEQIRDGEYSASGWVSDICDSWETKHVNDIE